jgi:hypothetical protein
MKIHYFVIWYSTFIKVIQISGMTWKNSGLLLIVHLFV